MSGYQSVSEDTGPSSPHQAAPIMPHKAEINCPEPCTLPTHRIKVDKMVVILGYCTLGSDVQMKMANFISEGLSVLKPVTHTGRMYSWPKEMA